MVPPDTVKPQEQLDVDNLGSFAKIGDGVYISKPTVAYDASRWHTSIDTTPPPGLIVVFGWMGAQISHLRKYTDVYEELYPTATRVLIEFRGSYFWSSETTKRANLAPLVGVLQNMGYVNDPHTTLSNDEVSENAQTSPVPGILIHIFSNGKFHSRLHLSLILTIPLACLGGCWQLTTLNSMLSESSQPQELRPIITSAIIFDSSPGIGSLPEAHTLFASPLPMPFASIVRSLFSFLYWHGTLTGRLPDGLPKSWTHMRKGLNNMDKSDWSPEIPWMSKQTRRLYLYSEIDALVEWKGVETHAADAQAAGVVDVQLVKFDGSAHVSHARSDPERYWGAIRGLWERAVGQVASAGKGVRLKSKL